MSYTTYLKLNGLTCNACKQVSERRIKRIAGVQAVTVDITTGTTEIIAERVVSPLEVQSVLNGTDYIVSQ